ncbi:MAG: hypothetical protein ACON5H_03400 [Akkermansiaceae bacterium]
MKILFLFLALSIPVLAQVYVPPKDNGGPANRTPTDTVVRPQENSSNNGNSGSILGNEIGVYNPQDDTISWNGSTWAAGNNRLFEMRFQKYLNEPEENSEAAQEYRATIKEILNILSPHTRTDQKLSKAAALLPRASSYPGDANLCDSLTNALFTAMLARKDVRATEALMEAQEKEKWRLIKKGDWKTRTDDDPDVGQANTGGGQGENQDNNNREATETGRGAQSLEYAEYLRRIAEIEGLKKTHQLKTEVKTELAKIQYQALMMQFFLQRRFEHVVMAARFYNLIWKDGDGALYMEKGSDIEKLFSEGAGFSPTVASLDSLANEAIRDVDKGVEAFKFLIEEKELESASKRLAESYLMGEFMPSIATLERTKKRKVLAFVREANVLLAAIDSKDYGTAGEQVTKLKSMAGDFDATKAEAAIAGYTRASNMHIGKAKKLLIERKEDEAGAEVQKAMEIWPQNPKLKEFDQLVEAGGTLAMARNDFDRLFSEENYREVFKRQYEFALAIKGDATREDQFEQVIKNIGSIERAVEGAREMSRVGQPYAAWEKLDVVHKKFPQDPVLNQEMTQMAPQVADFTRALQDAISHEENKQVGSALAMFYQARHIHPQSTIAQEGIDRLSKRALGMSAE